LFDEIASRGHDVTVFCSDESRSSGTPIESFRGKVRIVQIPTGRITKTNRLTKAINTVFLETRFINAIKKSAYRRFDLLIYSTPPITFEKVIRFLRERDHCATYLLLKDIFPQNAVDIGLIKEGGYIYKRLRNKEKRLYAVSDRIGCMSQANVEYLLAHNPEIPPEKVHVNPNSIRPTPADSIQPNKELLKKYGIPESSLKLIYGGNLGKPQGIDFMLDVLKALSSQKDVFTLIVGDGTEYNKIAHFLKIEKISNARLVKSLPKDQYLALLRTMDVGLIFLDHRFTIPNFPSRLLDYLDASLPVIAATDAVTDVGLVLERSGAGLCCQSDDVVAFLECVNKMKDEKSRISYVKPAYRLLLSDFDPIRSVDIILKE
jgi:hypothetical protein